MECVEGFKYWEVAVQGRPADYLLRDLGNGQAVLVQRIVGEEDRVIGSYLLNEGGGIIKTLDGFPVGDMTKFLWEGDMLIPLATVGDDGLQPMLQSVA